MVLKRSIIINVNFFYHSYKQTLYTFHWACSSFWSGPARPVVMPFFLYNPVQATRMSEGVSPSRSVHKAAQSRPTPETSALSAAVIIAKFSPARTRLSRLGYSLSRPEIKCACTITFELRANAARNNMRYGRQRRNHTLCQCPRTCWHRRRPVREGWYSDPGKDT